MLRPVLRDARFDGRAATASCARDAPGPGPPRNRPAGPDAPGASGPLRPRRAWTRKRRPRGWRPGPWPSAGAARRRPAGRPGTRGQGKRAPRKQEKSWLQLSPGRAAAKLWSAPWPEPVRGCAQSGGFAVLWPFSLAGTLPCWVVLLLGAADLVIRVLAWASSPATGAPPPPWPGCWASSSSRSWAWSCSCCSATSSSPAAAASSRRLVNDRVRSGISALADVESEYPGPEWVTSAGELNRRLGSLPMVDGNSVELIPGYPDSIAGHDRGRAQSQDGSSTPSSTS